MNEVLELFSRFDAELEIYAAQVRQAATATIRGEGGSTIPSLIAALGFSVAFLSVVATLSNNFANTLDEKKAKFEQQSTMDGQFANGKWPTAVADKLSDASVKDGDNSDWTPK